ncbi:uncharacterized protein [Triticum aestivum]|uniref:uncharacterized protein isoform X1 n=2 Tax=Triticum aestivum TaxID=4565 RepID=UPI001D01E885|nr:uncharacterized protein LOC123059436 isoform X1 [Triticum aestivum]
MRDTSVHTSEYPCPGRACGLGGGTHLTQKGTFAQSVQCGPFSLPCGAWYCRTKLEFVLHLTPLLFSDLGLEVRLDLSMATPTATTPALASGSMGAASDSVVRGVHFVSGPAVADSAVGVESRETLPVYEVPPARGLVGDLSDVELSDGSCTTGAAPAGGGVASAGAGDGARAVDSRSAVQSFSPSAPAAASTTIRVGWKRRPRVARAPDERAAVAGFGSRWSIVLPTTMNCLGLVLRSCTGHHTGTLTHTPKIFVKRLRENNVNLWKVYSIFGSLFGRMKNVPFTKRCLRTFCGKLSREHGPPSCSSFEAE